MTNWETCLTELRQEITDIESIPGFELHAMSLDLLAGALEIVEIEEVVEGVEDDDYGYDFRIVSSSIPIGQTLKAMQQESIAMNQTAATYGINMTTLVHVHSSRIWNMAMGLQNYLDDVTADPAGAEVSPSEIQVFSNNRTPDDLANSAPVGCTLPKRRAADPQGTA